MLKAILTDNKGLSAVEVIITFTLVATISISLLNVVMTYKDREETESYKQEIISYKNEITKLIEDDATKYIIKSIEKQDVANDGLGALCKSYDTEDTYYAEARSKNDTLNELYYKISFVLTDEVRNLKIDRLENVITYSETGSDGKQVDVKHPLPDLGTSSKERVGKYKCTNIPSLRISDMSIKEENGFFKMDINFYHNKVKLENRYGIHITAPINFS